MLEEEKKITKNTSNELFKDLSREEEKKKDKSNNNDNKDAGRRRRTIQAALSRIIFSNKNDDFYERVRL